MNCLVCVQKRKDDFVACKKSKRSKTQEQIDDEPCNRQVIVSANDLSCNYTPAKYEKAATTIERAHSSAPDMSHSSWNRREISSWSWRFWHAVCFSFLMCVGRRSLTGHNFFGTFNDFRLFDRKKNTILMCWLRCWGRKWKLLRVLISINRIETYVSLRLDMKIDQKF